MISHIFFNEEAIKQFKIKKTPNYFLKINNINVFAGINNSGKSRLIRTLFSDSRNVKYFKDNISDNDYKNIKDYFIKIYYNAILSGERYGLKLKKENNYYQKILKDDSKSLSFLFEVAIKLNRINKSFFINPYTNDNHLNATIEKFKNLIDLLFKATEQVQYTNIEKLYIPILRGLRPIQATSSSNDNFGNLDVYSNRTKFDYFIQLNPNQIIFSGLSIYEDIKKLLLGEVEERKIITNFEKFLEDEIFQTEVTLIPKYNEDVLNIKLGKQPQLAIYNLGDGIQTLISILFPIFIRKNNELLVFIEEPETHLHPKWQNLLIHCLSKFTNHTYFLTTHSTSFINNSNVSTFIIKKEEEISQIALSEIDSDKLEILNDLGYKTSDLLQTNFILWVEGLSDKIYFNYWIKLIEPELKEGIHYNIMFFGGSNYKGF